MQGSSAVGVAAAATGGLYVTALAAAPVSAVLLPLVPLPGLLLGGRHGSSALGTCVLLTTGIAALLLGGQAAATYLFALGAPTLAATAALRRQWSIERTVLMGAAAWTVAVAILLVNTYGSPGAVIEGVRERLQESFDLAIATWSGLGVTEDALADLALARDGVVAGVLEILPGMVALAGALTMLLNVLIVRALMPWLRVGDLRVWSAPPVLIWAFIAAGFCMFAPMQAVSVVARSAFVVLVGCYFCQGLAVVSFYLGRFQMRRGLRVVTYVLLLTQQVLVLVVVMLGVFDLWANFRRIGLAAAGDGDD